MKYFIDSHKLIFHPNEVSKWLKAKNSEELLKIYPIYVEFSPVGACNHRCVFCAFDYIGYKTVMWDSRIFKKRVFEMGKLGIKSMLIAGEGEPLFHKEIDLMAEYGKKAGIDVAFSTNFVFFDKRNGYSLIKHSKWIKVSINAGTRETYSKIHRTKPQDFDKVIDNI